MEIVKEMTDGIFRFQIQNNEASLMECSSRSGVLLVPERIEDIPVVEIGKKAFLGQRNLKHILLPDTVRSVGDWAFASCRNLEIVEFLGEGASLGRQVFQNCSRLTRILEKDLPADVSYLLGAVPLHMPERYLLDIRKAGTSEWIEAWDAGLLAKLRESDAEGFADQFMCGLENFGHQDSDSYQEERRMEKAEMAYLRLLHPYKLSKETEADLRNYLLRHLRGCESQAAWNVLLEHHGADMEYAGIYVDVCKESGGMDIDAHLQDIGEAFPELKAFFLKGNAEKEKAADFFEDLFLL